MLACNIRKYPRLQKLFNEKSMLACNMQKYLRLQKYPKEKVRINVGLQYVEKHCETVDLCKSLASIYHSHLQYVPLSQQSQKCHETKIEKKIHSHLQYVHCKNVINPKLKKINHSHLQYVPLSQQLQKCHKSKVEKKSLPSAICATVQAIAKMS